MTQQRLLLFLMSLSGYAASDDFDDLLSMNLDELLSVPIVGSTLTSHDLRSVPSAVTVFTRQTIEQLPVDYLYEIANLVPGFQAIRMGDSQHDYAVSSRGRRIADLSAEILVVLDGLRIDNPRTSSGLQYLSTLPLSVVEKIEFIRGPGAAIYGSNAMMGVINITTRKGVDQASLGLGSFDRAHLKLSKRINSGPLSWDLLLDMETESGQQYRVENSFGSGNSDTQDPKKNYLGQLAIAWQNSSIDVFIQHQREEQFYYFEKLENELNHNYSDLARLSYSYDLVLKQWQHQLNFSYSYSGNDSQTQLAPAGVLGDEAFVARIELPASSYQFNWHSSKQISHSQNLLLGAEYRHISVEEGWIYSNYQVSDVTNAHFPAQNYSYLKKNTVLQGALEQDVTGIFVQHEGQWTANTLVVAGLRYDKFEGTGQQLSSRLSVGYKLGQNHTVKFIYNEAFRAPTANERRIQNAPGLTGNDELKPESIQNTELIWIFTHNNGHLQLGIFETRFEDSILQINQEDIGRVYLNWDQDPVRGTELEYSLQLNDNNMLRTTATYLIDKPELSFREAAELFSITWNSRFSKSLNLNLTSTYRGQRQLASSKDIAPYWLASAKLSYKFNKSLGLSGQIKNLNDRQYYTPAQGLSPVLGIPNRGRELLLEANYRF